jgi:hypothetical protein
MLNDHIKGTDTYRFNKYILNLLLNNSPLITLHQRDQFTYKINLHQDSSIRSSF